MGIDAFVYRDEGDGRHFLTAFLASADFKSNGLKTVCKYFQTEPLSRKKNDLVNTVLELCIQRVAAQEAVIDLLLTRTKRWAYIALGQHKKVPACADARELLIKLGEERWYGPIERSDDENAIWYIRPIFIPHWERQISGESNKVLIRWLCYARVCNRHVSLHWNGFSRALTEVPDKTIQFEYWAYIPRIFSELQQLLQGKYRPLNFEELVLHTLWDRYRGDESFEWKDRTIHAEAGGISLNARAIRGSIELKEREIRGIERLAKTIRVSIDSELVELTGKGLIQADKFDEIILRTLIREYNPLSYELSLRQKDGDIRIFRAHSYFGKKPNSSIPDSLSHIKFYSGWADELKQLNFLLEHAEFTVHDQSEPTQFSLF